MLVRMRPALATLLSLLMLSTGISCSANDDPTSGEVLPEAEPLLEASAEAMAGLSSVAFMIDIDGEPSALSIQQASGSLKQNGDVSATAQLYQAGRLIEAEYIRVAGTSYLKLATGGFREVSEAIAARIFDPALLLDAEAGIPAALAAARDATTEAVEEVDGVEAYRVTATIDPSRIEGLTLLVSGTAEPATLWVSTDGDHLVRAELDFRTPGDEDPTRLTVTFSEFDESVDIQAPI